MSDWKTKLAGIGDEYLMGLANKGIVKRAYKDKEETPVEILSRGEEACVKVGEETVTIRMPLGESKCSCPSRSICRHVILGILVLQERAARGVEGGAPEAGEAGEASESDPQGVEGGAPEAGEAGEASESDPRGVEGGASEAALQRRLLGEIGDYPVARLRKAMGVRAYQSFLRQVKSGNHAQITLSGVAVVVLPGDTERITLLSPLEYSTCTCHKKELCAHKAEAILWSKLVMGQVTSEELSGELLESQEFRLEKIREAAGQMKEFLLELLETGLSRTSPDILNYLERLAIISHDAALPNFENDFRALHDSYQRYLKRVASFQTRELLSRIMRLYAKVCMLLETKSAAEIARLAGEFKADYLEAGSLELKGIAVEEFHSSSGYAGETVYFLEERTREWYTYTVARPVFYDNGGKRRNPARAQAPWGLEMPLEDLARVSITLKGAKCDGRRRLSSSQESRAEVRPEPGLFSYEETGWYYRDFGELFARRIPRKDTWLREQEDPQEGQILVFLQPAACERAEFDETSQRLSLPLYDKEGREVTAEITYSKREDRGIRYLERISEQSPPCFFGRIYLRDGKIRMYPIAALEPDRRAEGATDRMAGDPARWEADSQSAETESSREADSRSAETLQPDDRSVTERIRTLQALSEVLEEAMEVLENQFQSGFDTPSDAVLEEMKGLEKETAQFGLAYLSQCFQELGEVLGMRRHSLKGRMGENREAPAQILSALMEYLYLCSEKTIYDMAAESYAERKKNV